MRGRLMLAALGILTLAACTPPTQPSPTSASPTINININSNNAGTTDSTPTAAGCGSRKTAELGWSVLGGTLPGGEVIARFAPSAPKGSIVQFDFTPKDSAGALPSGCHGAISYATPAGPCRAVSVSPESFDPRVEITDTSGVCQLRATVDGVTATAEIQAAQ